MTKLQAALYARVSSEQQVQDQTIDSQIAGLEEQIKKDGYELLATHHYLDKGYSGSS